MNFFREFFLEFRLQVRNLHFRCEFYATKFAIQQSYAAFTIR